MEQIQKECDGLKEELTKEKELREKEKSDSGTHTIFAGICKVTYLYMYNLYAFNNRYSQSCRSVHVLQQM